MLPRKKKRIALLGELANSLNKSISNSYKKISYENMRNMYLKNKYPDDIIDKCRIDYGLDIDHNLCCISWPVFLEDEIKEINICAVNLGICTLLDAEEQNGHRISSLQTSTLLKAALNTLIITSKTELRLGKTIRYWPTHIDYTNRLEYGTIIQSVLSLSTLLRIGFLSPGTILSANNDQEVILKKRVEFIMECLNWIASLEGNNNPTHASWSYAEKCIETGHNNALIHTALIPSEYSFETLKKYRDLFTNNSQLMNIVSALDDKFISEIEKICKRYKDWFLHEQQADGGFFVNSNKQDSSSFPFSCAALSFFSFVNPTDTRPRPELIKLIDYLCKKYKHFKFPFADVCDSYKYQYCVEDNTDYIPDAYEIIPAAILLANGCQILDKCGNSLPKKYQKKLRHINYRCLDFIKDQKRKINIGNTGENVVIQGGNTNEGLQYPIYAVYYVHNCLKTYLRRENESGNHSYIAIPPLFNMKIVILLIILISLTLFAFYLDIINALQTIIFEIVFSVGSLFLGVVFRNE